MDHYFKTDLGIQALKQRSFQLNARQRQLLLLIGTYDFKILNSGLKSRLATPERIQELEDLGLIFQNQINHPLNIESKTQEALVLDQPVSHATPPQTHLSGIVHQFEIIQKNETIQSELTYISFDEIKQKMMDLLHIHCGLMAKQLILKIQQATTLREIKLCQMQWITTLQESKISPVELNHTMQRINHALQHLQPA